MSVICSRAERGEQTIPHERYMIGTVLRWKKRRWRGRRRETFNTHTTIARWTFKPNRLGPSRASLGARVPCLNRSLSPSLLFPMAWMDISSCGCGFSDLPAAHFFSSLLTLGTCTREYFNSPRIYTRTTDTDDDGIKREASKNRQRVQEKRNPSLEK